MSKALAPRTDFYDVWHRFITSGDTEGAPNNVRESWKRCRDKGIDPTKEPSTLAIDEKGLAKRIDVNLDLHHLLERHYKEIEGQFDFTPFVILFTDSKGYVLSIQGEDKISRMLERSGLKAGSSINECDVGTTAPGISLAEQRPTTIFAEEHYFQGFHWASCFSIPIWDHKKNILGCLDFTSTLHFGKKLEHLIPYFCNIAHSLQFEVFLKRKLELLELHDCYFRSTFEYADKALILADRGGQIIDLNASAQRSLGPNVNKFLRRNVGEVLDLSQTWSFPSPQKRTQIVRLHAPNRANSTPFSMEIIPILSKSGDEIAYLLRLERERVNVTLPGKASNTARFSFENIVGHSPRILDATNRARRVAKTSSNVLLEGETGTGKELFANAIHSGSNYSDGPFVALNCCAIPQELVESELFGYERGAYTGARREGNAGKFELANRGTIFLDEIHAMTESAQMKLLRVLEDREITRIGGTHSIPLDLRVIAASSKNLEEEVASGNFIEPLFFRLNVVRLCIPSLRTMREDIPDLVESFIKELNRKFNRTIQGVAPEVLETFSQYGWPGNIRELRNCMEYAFNFAEDDLITLKDLEGKLLTVVGEEISKGESIEGLTEKLMAESLDRFKNVKDAAEFLGLSVSTFYRKMKKYGLSK
jgi:sigma-54 dependent transcriptional regulator, acetoin dehydrogenase operon transcriptional activator AcoR